MNPSEEFVADLLDLSTFDYSLQWSTEEAEVYEALLSSKPSPPSPEEPAPPRQHSKNYLTLKRYRTKRRQEVDELRRAAKELEERLLRLQHAKSVKDALHPPTKWQSLAVKERRLEQTAQAENLQLRELVQDHMITAQILSNVLEKTRQQAQNISFLHSAEDKWKQLVLVADPALRVRGIHAIVDREFSLLESAFVEAGLIDVASGSEIQRHISKYSHAGSLEFHTIVYSRANLPFASVLDSIWSVILGTVNTVPCLNRYSDEVTTVDANTMYVRGRLDHPLGNFQRCVVVKRFFAPGAGGTMCYMVCRSIDDDELAPYRAEPPYSKEVSWLAIEPMVDGSVHMKFFEKFRPSAWTEAMPLSAHWVRTFEDGAQAMRDAVRRYIFRHGENLHDPAPLTFEL
ncbi:hypothetical protein SPRG_01197 [Saprolegnia parasitica CBS 223.65]|uniref:START domain-containing protein n=1 Tax=Saprolegnia parasitica (strain CBS 223.65) TaxID=695850 RepID=A0A067D0W5_SAPPC|nr:hypothetical protein SPRG_01197 [Saprolegnia parasitica CBS 223.65]KDO35130.1 hypothetical protein SPRG_01197 [Saprolegnia parasitica CBS 223.65]|eukprot:XP_012194779.1 hypothetical protein SPRG_01197 [Saprolegnia parasitica CBS 223.65]